NPRDIPGFIKALRKTRFTIMSGVNTLYNKLLDDPGFDQVKQANGGALKLAVAGGMSLQRVVAERRQPKRGVPLLAAYRLSEASRAVCASPAGISAGSGATGMATPSAQVEMRDAAGYALPPGEAGELCVQGPQVMRGYWHRPDESAHVLGAAGW